MKKSTIKVLPDESLAALLVAIEAYFDCRLSDEEEKRLRLAIARTRVAHPAINEAKAVMGLGKMEGRKKPRRLWTPVNIAASIALLIAGGWGVSSRYFSQLVEGQTVAYVNGVKVTDEDEVMRLFAANFAIMRQGIEDVDNRVDKMLEIMEPAIEGYNSEKPLDDI